MIRPNAVRSQVFLMYCKDILPVRTVSGHVRKSARISATSASSGFGIGVPQIGLMSESSLLLTQGGDFDGKEV